MSTCLCYYIMSGELHCGAVNMLRGRLYTNTVHWYLQPVIPVGLFVAFFPRCWLPYQNTWNMTGPASLSGPFTVMMYCMWHGLVVARICGGVELEQHCPLNTQTEYPHTFTNAHIHAFMNTGANDKRTCSCILEWALCLLRLYIFNKSSPVPHCFTLCRKCLQGVEVAC